MPFRCFKTFQRFLKLAKYATGSGNFPERESFRTNPAKARANRTRIFSPGKLSEVPPGPRGKSREQRLVSRCHVEFDRPSGAVEAETEDMSAHGLFIRTDSLLPVGEETELRLTLPDQTFLLLHGRVAHMLTPHAARALGRHPGMGFELIGTDEDARMKLRAHLDSIKVEITNPGLSTTTQAVIVEPSAPLRQRVARCLEGAGFKI